MTETTPPVVDREELSRYEIGVGDDVAYLAYRKKIGRISLDHTEVPEGLRGQGLAQRLARHALEEARRTGEHVVVRCPFVTTWLKRHPEYNDLVIARVPDDRDS